MTLHDKLQQAIEQATISETMQAMESRKCCDHAKRLCQLNIAAAVVSMPVMIYHLEAGVCVLAVAILALILGFRFHHLCKRHHAKSRLLASLLREMKLAHADPLLEAGEVITLTNELEEIKNQAP